MSKEARNFGKIQNQWLDTDLFRCSNGAGNILRLEWLSFFTDFYSKTSSRLHTKTHAERIFIPFGLSVLGELTWTFNRQDRNSVLWLLLSDNQKPDLNINLWFSWFLASCSILPVIIYAFVRVVAIFITDRHLPLKEVRFFKYWLRWKMTNFI